MLALTVALIVCSCSAIAGEEAEKGHIGYARKRLIQKIVVPSSLNYMYALN